MAGRTSERAMVLWRADWSANPVIEGGPFLGSTLGRPARRTRRDDESLQAAGCRVLAAAAAASPGGDAQTAASPDAKVIQGAKVRT